MARNRKRTKDRRVRQPQPVTAPDGRRGSDPLDGPESLSAPDPIAHATPDAELAEAQLALGRPDLVPSEGQAAFEPEPDDDELEAQAVQAAPAAPGGSGGGRRGGPGGSGREAPLPSGSGGELAAPRARPGTRLVGFMQGSWRELQRVQWPDRRQVMQATGVVIGFVIIAGVFLGVADTLAGHLMNYILNGHW